MIACAEPRCPNSAVHRGRCILHGKTTAQQGYDSRWRRKSEALRVGASCETCGTTRDLTVDHVVPHDERRLRVLCRSCHARIGARRDRAGRSKSLRFATVAGELPQARPPITDTVDG